MKPLRYKRTCRLSQTTSHRWEKYQQQQHIWRKRVDLTLTSMENKRLTQLQHCFHAQAVSVFYFLRESWQTRKWHGSIKRSAESQHFHTERVGTMFPGNISRLFFAEYSSTLTYFMVTFLTLAALSSDCGSEDLGPAIWLHVCSGVPTNISAGLDMSYRGYVADMNIFFTGIIFPVKSSVSIHWCHFRQLSESLNGQVSCFSFVS